MRTRSQVDLEHAARLIQAIAAQYPDDSNVRKIYGGLCHTFPVLVMQCGLAQAVAFHQDKAATAPGKSPTDRNLAHQLILSQFNEVLGNPDLAQLSLTQYIQATRRVLAAWVFFKRLAVSVLKVKSGEEVA